MQPFRPLDKEQSIKGSLAIEASAGTGKTFSIEHFVVRSLAENPALTIDKILVVTFTKAAAQELRRRIRKNLENALVSLRNGDYSLFAYLENLEAPREAERRLRHALVHFDRSMIMTIHAFCYRSLQAGHFKPSGNIDDEQGKALLKAWEAVSDTLRSETFATSFSPGQKKWLWKGQGYSPQALGRSLLRIISKGMEIAETKSNLELLHDLSQSLLPFTSLVDLGERTAPNFKGVCQGKTSLLKHEVAHFFELLQQMKEAPSEKLMDELADLDVHGHFIQSNLKKKVAFSPEDLPFVQAMETHFAPLFEEWGGIKFLHARLARNCQERLWDVYEKEGCTDFTYMIKKMEELSKNEDFCLSLKEQLHLVIIDEFQDTDPVQWSIFKRLFWEKQTPLVLVGDPKQSIYAFRSADIYTYLEATSLIAPEAHFSLPINYRSTPQLVEALNHFFDPSYFPGWLPLPLNKSDLPFHPVSAASEKEPLEGAPSLEINWVDAPSQKLDEIEASTLFPYMALKISELPPNETAAVLVRDHAQSDRLAAFLSAHGLPFLQRRESVMHQAPILSDLLHLMRGITHPRNPKYLLASLGTRFFQYDHKRIEEISQSSEKRGRVITQFLYWRELFIEKGWIRGIDTVLKSILENDTLSVEEKILSLGQGRTLLHQIRQISEWAHAQHARYHFILEDVVKELEIIAAAKHPLQEDFRLKSLVDSQGIHILTMHLSKGLEFDTVFALGLINRTPLERGLLNVKMRDRTILKPLLETDPLYTLSFDEIEAEKARQLYVAMTRAKKRVYVPLVTGWKGPKKGESSPLELHLARLGVVLGPSESVSLEPLQTWISQCSSMALKKLEPSTFIPQKTHTHNVEKTPPVNTPLTLTPYVTTSYSKLAKEEGEEEYLPLEGTPHDFDTEERTLHTLPAGSFTGDLLHRLLATIPIDSLTPEFCSDYLENASIPPEYLPWKEVLSHVACSAYSTPLPLLNIPLIKAASLVREMEFLFPTRLASKLSQGPLPQGEVKGFIDLSFVYDNKVYIVDWKTNWLGKTPESYDPETLAKVCHSYRYDLQASLYAIALQKYIEIKAPHLSYGGAFYIFLRGFKDGFGVHFFP